MSTPKVESRNSVQRNIPPAELAGSVLQPEEHVLSTLEADGSRRWLFPRLAKGRFWNRRRWTAYILIAIFTLLPHLRINGKPAVLLDITRRQFTIFGFTFLPTDTLLLALFMVSVFVTIFLITALVGRVWCGWACPQTVYMEYLFRPIDRLFEKTAGYGGQPRRRVEGWRFLARAAVYLVVCSFLAHTFLSYFVGTEALARWMRQSPLEHPMPFFVMAATTGLMMYDFMFFREQLCLIACPYGRFQSVMLDRRSLIVAYDINRGEPRGKIKSLPIVEGNKPQGDCIDCKQCVHVCPTGIDIRNGLQMECINCTQCIDACDAVMDKIDRPRGLIRYSCQDAIEGKGGTWLRPRLLIYPTLLIIAITSFFVVFATKQSFDASLIRNFGNPFVVTKGGQVQNSIRLKIVNRDDEVRTYSAELVDIPNARLSLTDTEPLQLESGESRLIPMLIEIPPSGIPGGARDVKVKVIDDLGAEKVLPVRILGPR